MCMPKLPRTVAKIPQNVQLKRTVAKMPQNVQKKEKPQNVQKIKLLSKYHAENRSKFCQKQT